MNGLSERPPKNGYPFQPYALRPTQSTSRFSLREYHHAPNRELCFCIFALVRASYETRSSCLTPKVFARTRARPRYRTWLVGTNPPISPCNRASSVTHTRLLLQDPFGILFIPPFCTDDGYAPTAHTTTVHSSYGLVDGHGLVSRCFTPRRELCSPRFALHPFWMLVSYAVSRFRPDPQIIGSSME